MTVSMSGYALEEVFAEPADAPAAQETASDDATQDTQDAGAGTEAGSVDVPENGDSGEEASGAESADADADADPVQETETTAEPGEGDVTGGGEEQPEDPSDPEVIEVSTITVSLYNRDGTMKLSWEPVEEAVTYTVTKTVCSAYDKNQKYNEGLTSFDTEEPEYTFEDLFPGRMYTFTVTARDENGEVRGRTDKMISAQPILSPVKKRSRSSKTIKPKRVSFNGNTDLRSHVRQKYNGYAVMQGGCTDGKYAYYLMVKTKNQHGKVAKVDLVTKKVVKVSKVLDTWHGNGMTYDSRRHRLVVNACTILDNGVSRKQELTFIDADTLKITKQKNVKYNYFKNDNKVFRPVPRSKGIASIAYSEKYDVYIANQRDYHDLIIIDPDTLEAMGLVMTRIIDKYPGGFQAMDGDDQYAYLLLSKYNKRQPNNIILALDWNSSRLLDRNGHRRQYVHESWVCANGRKPVAVYKIKTPYEAENIYHTTDSSGKTHFYMGEYNCNQQYKTKIVRKKYKAKWKKVTKKYKKKVKWKKVRKKVKWKKVRGKWKYKTKKVWKYKYKWKTKKVWKYKTKYKKVKKKIPTYKHRLDYVYDLGII